MNTALLGQCRLEPINLLGANGLDHINRQLDLIDNQLVATRLGDGQRERLTVARDFDVTGELKLFEDTN